jgi:glycerol-3-phosphate acyltransferase PlsY
MYFLVAILAYFLGSIPSAFLLGKKYGLDIRKVGSGNVGTMNTRLVLGGKLALLVLLMDLAKGAFAVGLAHAAGVNPFFAASFAAIGHIHPIWLRFQGGKGLATAAGALIAAGYFQMVAIFLIIFIISYYLLKQEEQASILAVIAAAGLTLLIKGFDVFLLSLTAVIVYKYTITLLRS